jgi:hypothetical protein
MQEEHKIFMQEYEKYGSNCMQIARVLSTRTPAQIKKHAECFFKQNLKANSAAVKRYQESLSPKKKAAIIACKLQEFSAHEHPFKLKSMLNVSSNKIQKQILQQ